MEKSTVIFVADDDHDDHFFFEEALAKTGVPQCNVTAFYDGRQMLDHLQVIDSKDLLPDAIVLDLNMPVLDGLAALGKLKSDSKYQSIPVFILTTSTSKEQMAACKKLGCIEYYVKPVKLEDLKQIIEDILDKVA